MKKLPLVLIISFFCVIAIALIIQLLLFSLVPTFIVESERFWAIPSTSNYMNTACVAASALFTAFAFGATFYAIRQQQKETQKQKENTLRATTLNVFTRTFNELQNKPTFIKAQEYVLYNLRKDIEQIKSLTQISENSDIQIGTKEIMEFSKENYNLMMYFLTKMEYIGVIVKKEYIDEIILDYFGEIIINSYDNLKVILSIDKNRSGRNSYFIHYLFLYNVAKKRKEDFMNECQYYLDNGYFPPKAGKIKKRANC